MHNAVELYSAEGMSSYGYEDFSRHRRSRYVFQDRGSDFLLFERRHPGRTVASMAHPTSSSGCACGHNNDGGRLHQQGDVAVDDDLRAVLPEGAELTPDPVSVFVEGDQATIDVSVEVDGKTPSRYWAFLHEVDGKWRIHATMPLDPLKLDGVPQPSSTVTARESSDG